MSLHHRSNALALERVYGRSSVLINARFQNRRAANSR